MIGKKKDTTVYEPVYGIKIKENKKICMFLSYGQTLIFFGGGGAISVVIFVGFFISQNLYKPHTVCHCYIS